MKDQELKFTIESRLNNTMVLCLNGVPLAGTINKSQEFYEGFIEGFKRSMNTDIEKLCKNSKENNTEQ